MESVINLSTRKLSTDEMSILSRGLKFCPTPPCPDPGQGREDLDKLHRRLRLKSHFVPSQNTSTATVFNRNDPNLFSSKAFSHHKFKKPSTWRGPIGPATLEAYIASNEMDYNLRPSYTPPQRQNISPGERKALRSLTQDRSIVIKPADKGSSIVVLNRLDYLREGYKQLSDDKFYKRMNEDLTVKHVKEVNDLIEDTFQNTRRHLSDHRN